MVYNPVQEDSFRRNIKMSKKNIKPLLPQPVIRTNTVKSTLQGRFTVAGNSIAGACGISDGLVPLICQDGPGHQLIPGKGYCSYDGEVD